MEQTIKVLVLGGRGMLGSMVAGVLREKPDLDVTTTATGELERGEGAEDRPAARSFDATRDRVEGLLESDDYSWVINAIGVTKPHIVEGEPGTIARAIDVNAAFPFRLAAAAAERGQRVIQIATDGVFAGTDAPYDESAPHDAADIYGKTKSLGEVPAPNVHHLRCSIVGGPEASRSLLGWALSHPRGATITGYINHRWNGITTWHFAKLCEGLIGGRAGDLPSPLHVVPADSVSKAELLELALRAFGRTDISVAPQPAARAVDRTLRTSHPGAGRRLWAAAGHDRPPPIAEMIETLALRLRDPARVR